MVNGANGRTVGKGLLPITVGMPFAWSESGLFPFMGGVTHILMGAEQGVPLSGMMDWVPYRLETHPNEQLSRGLARANVREAIQSGRKTSIRTGTFLIDHSWKEEGDQRREYNKDWLNPWRIGGGPTRGKGLSGGQFRGSRYDKTGGVPVKTQGAWFRWTPWLLAVLGISDVLPEEQAGAMFKRLAEYFGQDGADSLMGMLGVPWLSEIVQAMVETVFGSAQLGMDRVAVYLKRRGVSPLLIGVMEDDHFQDWVGTLTANMRRRVMAQYTQ